MQKILLLIVWSCLALPLAASPLDDAKNSGHVAEMVNGYVEALATADAVVHALVGDINARRKAAYSKIAKKHGISTEKVATESYKKRAKS
ncbi:MAG: hypothetical protein ACI9CE_001961 [Flavobacterium sp.]